MYTYIYIYIHIYINRNLKKLSNLPKVRWPMSDKGDAGFALLQRHFSFHSAPLALWKCRKLLSSELELP